MSIPPFPENNPNPIEIAIHACYSLYQARDENSKEIKLLPKIREAIRASISVRKWLKGHPAPNSEDNEEKYNEWENEYERQQDHYKNLYGESLVDRTYGSVEIQTSEHYGAFKKSNFYIVKIKPEVWLVILDEDKYWVLPWKELVRFIPTLGILNIKIDQPLWVNNCGWPDSSIYNCKDCKNESNIIPFGNLSLPSNEPSPNEIALYMLYSLYQTLEKDALQLIDFYPKVVEWKKQHPFPETSSTIWYYDIKKFLQENKINFEEIGLVVLVFYKHSEVSDCWISKLEPDRWIIQFEDFNEITNWKQVVNFVRKSNIDVISIHQPKKVTEKYSSTFSTVYCCLKKCKKNKYKKVSKKVKVKI